MRDAEVLLLAELGCAARERRAIVLRQRSGGRFGVLPLWPVAGPHGHVDVLSIVWRPYRCERLQTDAWTIEAGDNQSTPVVVPAVDLTSRVPLHRHDDATGRQVEDLRRIAEAAALAERFGLEVRIGYAAPGRGTVEERQLARVVVRNEVLVAADLEKDAPRSFRFDRIHWIEAADLKQAPRWSGADYERPT